MNLYISDLHFGHANVIKHDQRPFMSVEEMDHMLIDLWNARVGSEDHVYILGDFCYKSGRQEQWYLNQLMGQRMTWCVAHIWAYSCSQKGSTARGCRIYEE